MNFRSDIPPQGTRGVFIAIATVLAIVVGALAVGWVVLTLASTVVENAGGNPLPAWWLLIIGGVVLVPLLLATVRLLPWLVSWYYLLPAIVFLLAFTVFPIVLTVNFAFTNYSGANSGEPDSSTAVAVTRVAPNQVRIDQGESLENLGCVKPDCIGQGIAIRDVNDPSKVRRFSIKAVDNGVITLNRNLPANALPAGTMLRVNPISYIGISNFSEMFARATVQLWPVFAWTVIFATATVLINALAGLILGILLNNKRLKFRNFYRTLLFLPWAVPAVISVQMWRGLLNVNGTINRLLGLLGLPLVPWLDVGDWAKIAILMVSLWLGFPYMMTATLGALSTIPDELYEAAQVDGATRWQQIRNITLPMITAAFTPILLSSFAFNFNNFGIVYLLTEGGPAEPGNLATARSTDILISWGFNTAFTNAGNAAYGPASAIALVVALLTIGISIVNFRLAGVFKEARR